MKETYQLPVEKHILIYGGSFDPPTLGHVAAIEHALNTPLFDEVWVMPSRARKDKAQQSTENERLTMLQLMKEEAFSNDPRLSVTDFELILPRPTRTAQSHRTLVNHFPFYEFTFLVGADSMQDMGSWQEFEYLIENVPWLVIDRPGYEVGDLLPLASMTQVGMPNISSTEVRTRARTNQSLRPLVVDSVARYIKERRLYEEPGRDAA